MDRREAGEVVQATASQMFSYGGGVMAAMPHIVVALTIEVATQRQEMMGMAQEISDLKSLMAGRPIAAIPS